MFGSERADQITQAFSSKASSYGHLYPYLIAAQAVGIAEQCKTKDDQIASLHKGKGKGKGKHTGAKGAGKA